ncbi:MAG: N-acyl homoserine lactonase family protein [Desulfobacteraceae bacterium]|nr:N-acyl homoserine lactonase family protein [Desulfobacteraceae bacterium]
MRLYVMSCGRIRARKKIFVPNTDKHVYLDAPMPVFLISHPEGNVLFDTGPNPEVFSNPEAVWGGLSKAFNPIGDSDCGVVPQLNRIGFTPGDIRYVVNSHLHFDHAGGNRFFPNAIFLVAKKEIKCARSPEFQEKGYFSKDWDLDLNYQPIEEETDLFADGRLVIIPMPGHTLGHQVLLVRLKNSGTIVLTGDCVPCQENFNHRILSGNNLDDQAARNSIENLHDLAVRENAILIHGHDPDQWAELKKAPDFYD